MLVGLDEAGAGPAYGSLWAAAVHLPVAVDGLADSKALTPARRAAVRERVLAVAAYGLGEVTAAEIDAAGMAEARRLVFERALDDFVARGHATPTELVVDGTIFRPWRGVPHACVPKADATVPCVAAASVLAKTTRDAQVEAWCDADPTLDARYALRKNKGYLSPAHVAGLKAHGPADRHRRSFRIRALEGA
jgi:ribonuclease HII